MMSSLEIDFSFCLELVIEIQVPELLDQVEKKNKEQEEAEGNSKEREEEEKKKERKKEEEEEEKQKEEVVSSSKCILTPGSIYSLFFPCYIINLYSGKSPLPPHIVLTHKSFYQASYLLSLQSPPNFVTRSFNGSLQISNSPLFVGWKVYEKPIVYDVS